MKRDLNGLLTVVTVAAGIVLLALFIQYVYYENAILAPAERENDGGTDSGSGGT